MNKNRRTITAVVALMAMSMGGCSTTAAMPDRVVPTLYEPVAIGGLEADEVFASTTEADWTRESDYVAVVKVESEVELPPVVSETERGGGFLGRNVTLAVQSIVWKHPDTKLTLPASFTFVAAGWMRVGGEKRRIGFADQPYLVVGHYYLMALRYIEFGCPGKTDPGDAEPRKVWAPIGGQAMIPFDKALGTGEFEGRAAERVGAADRVSSFRKAAVAKDSQWVADRLTAAHSANVKLTHKQGPLAECSRS